MLKRIENRLADGTLLTDLINRATREVQLRVLSDREIYDLEMERIFGKTWLLLGHESEIPEAGDFVVRNMGEDSVIVARGDDGKIHVSLNVCPHRGMRVCLADEGNAKIHTCIYHGWVFKPNGDFVGSPIAREKMHGDLMPKEELGLKKARVTSYGGLIFATWNIDGPSFEEFLGDTKWYFDILFKRTDSGLEALGPPQRFVVKANWKAASEQSASDGFHTLTLHRWLGEIGGFGGGDLTTSMYGVEVCSPHGHSLRCIDVTRKFPDIAEQLKSDIPVEEKIRLLPPPGISRAMVPELLKNLSAGQLKVMTEAPPQVGGMFPNLLFAFVFIPQPNAEPIGLTLVHTYVPRGPDKLEFVNWVLAEKDTPEDIKKVISMKSTQMFGTSGMVEQDDSDTWPHMTLSAKGAMGKKITMKYQAVHSGEKPEGWPGPGIVYDGFTKDDTQWHWWLYWHELMTSNAAD